MLLVSTLVILVSPRIEIAIIGILASQIVSFLYLAWVSKKYFAITFNHYIEYAKNLLSFGSRVLGANAVNLINYHGDLLLVGFFLTSSDVGVYGIAVGLGKFFWLFPQAIQTVTYPTLSEHWKRNETTTVRMIVDKSTKYAALMLVPTGLMIGFYADEVIGLIFGPNFEGAVLPLRILLIGTVANGVMQRPIGSMLFSLGKPGLNLRIFTIGAVVNLSLNLVFIPSIGVSGAAMASSISFALITILVLFYIRRITGITIEAGWFMKLWSLALVCILMEIAVAEMYHASIGVVLVSGVFLLIWFRLLCVDDRRRIREIVKSAVSASFRLR